MSSFHVNQLKFAFGLGGMLSFYGLVMVIVWMLPPTTASYNYKIAVVAAVLLTLPFALIIMFVASRRAKKKRKQLEAEKAGNAEAAAVPQQQQQQQVAANAGVDTDIDAGAQETIQFLRSSNLGENGKDAVYSLPWYIVAGPAKAGKSSLVLGSNLNYQTLPSQRQSEQKFIRPTAAVDWRVTSEAVFVDTSGRYQGEGGEAEEWASLLETIKKNRPNRPVDGFILTIDCEQILKGDEREIEESAKLLRSRLDDAVARLKVNFPVYLVFTHADAIEGFRDSFSTSKNEGKNLVWGATIPIEKSEEAQSMFDGEYELLHSSLMKRRLARLSAPFPPVRQLRIFNFPLHFGSARRRFAAFVNTLFRPNPFSQNPFLRGYYFTAAPPAPQTGNTPQTVGQTYFTERLTRDVILRDKDLVQTFIAQKQRAPIFGWMMTFLGALLVLGLLAMSFVSLLSNRQILQNAEGLGGQVLTIARADAKKNVLDKTEDETRRELNAVEDLRVLMSELDTYERDGAPIYLRFGLYSGNHIYKKNLLPIYMTVVEKRFKAPTVSRMEADLRKFAASQPVVNPSQLTDAEEKNLAANYDLLKAYLMLTGQFKEKADGTHIANTLKTYWTSESKVPPDMKLVALQQLDFWAKQVDRDDDDYRFPRISPDGKLIADARNKLQAFPAPYRYLSRKVTEISKEIDDKVGQTSAEAILARNAADATFITGSYAVPSAYTRSGYELMKVAIAEADQKLSEDDWVMGEDGKKQAAQSTDAAKIEDRYMRDYADNWRRFVKGIEVKPYRNKDDASAALQSFSSANSPIKILAREIAKNTNLSAQLEPDGWFEWIKSFIFRKKATGPGSSAPEKDFRPLFTFVGDPSNPQNSNLEKYQAEIGKLYNDFNGRSDDEIKKIAQEMANDKDPLKIRQRDTAITGLISGFNETAAGQDLAALLQKPIGNLRSLLGAGAREQIIKIWNEQILPEAKQIERGYPFEDGDSETDLTKLTAFLNPVDGKFSKFFDDRLSKYFDEVEGKYKVKEGSEVVFDDAFVEYLNNLMRLRKGLFGSNPTPKFEYEFAFKPSKDALIEVTIDGQKTDSSGTGSLKGTFPGASATETGVLMKVAGLAAPSTTTPPSDGTSTTSTVAGNEGTKIFQGNWGLFRFVDAGGAAKQANGEYLLNYSVGGKSVSATIKPSGVDLFDKNVFRQAKAPQTFLK